MSASQAKSIAGLVIRAALRLHLDRFHMYAKIFKIDVWSAQLFKSLVGANGIVFWGSNRAVQRLKCWNLHIGNVETYQQTGNYSGIDLFSFLLLGSK